MSIKELRQLAGMRRPEFAQYFGIPYRTVQNWELEEKSCAPYLQELIAYKLRAEGFIK